MRRIVALCRSLTVRLSVMFTLCMMTAGPVPSLIDHQAPQAFEIPPLGVSPAWTGQGASPVTWFGGSVASAGDINGDGYSDIIVGDYLYRDNQNELEEGSAAVYFGSSSGLPLYPDWRVQGNQIFAHLGYTVASAGDVNGDGYSDVLIGEPGYHVFDPDGYYAHGRVDLYLGSPWGLACNPDWVLARGGEGHGRFGETIASAGDVNNDGYSDVILGDNGRAEVHLGSPMGLIDTPGWIVEGTTSTGFVGSTVAAAGDVNGDGFGDVMVTTSWRDGTGRPSTVSVYLGSTSGLSTTPSWSQSELTPAGFGFSLSTAGDINGDGYDDILVGQPYLGGGVVYVYLGSSTGPSETPEWTLSDDYAYSRFGLSVASAGDINCDGYDDVIIGAPSYWGGYLPAGRSVVYLGSASGLSPIPQWVADGLISNEFAGYSVASAGDVNGDGAGDVVVGAPNTPQGHAYVYLGISTACAQPLHPCDFEGLVSEVANLDATDHAKRGLRGKLDEAQKALDRDDTAVAINKLNDFRNQVAGQAGRGISQSDADSLDACASHVILLLQEPPWVCSE